MSFAYGDDVGVRSVPAIEAMAARSGISLTMTNGDPPGSGAFHGTHNACDFSNGGNAGTPEMDAFARYWLGYAPYLLELIHVNQDGSGTYVKMGQVVDATFYESVLGQHKNHVHVAATNHGIMAAQAGGPSNVTGVTAGNSATASLASFSIPGVSQVTDLYTFITTFHNWVRLAEFIAGGFLLFLGVKALSESVA